MQKRPGTGWSCIGAFVWLAVFAVASIVPASAQEGDAPARGTPAPAPAHATATDAAAVPASALPEFRLLPSTVVSSSLSTASQEASGPTANDLFSDRDRLGRGSQLAVGPSYPVQTDSPTLNLYLFEMQAEVYRRYRRLFDNSSVLSSKRFYDFSRRTGATPSFARFDLPEGSSDDERIAMASSIEAARRTLARTDAVQYLVGRVSLIEDVTNWSIVHGEKGYSSGFDVRSVSRSRTSGSDTSSVDASVDSRFSVERLVDDPKEVIELRGRYQKFVEMSVFPLKHQIEMGSPLLSGKRFDLRAALTVDPGTSRGDFLVSLNLRF